MNKFTLIHELLKHRRNKMPYEQTPGQTPKPVQPGQPGQPGQPHDPSRPQKPGEDPNKEHDKEKEK
jgi:hypothetical protein